MYAYLHLALNCLHGPGSLLDCLSVCRGPSLLSVGLVLAEVLSISLRLVSFDLTETPGTLRAYHRSNKLIHRQGYIFHILYLIPVSSVVFLQRSSSFLLAIS